MTPEFDGQKYEKASTHQKEWGTKLIAELKLKGTEHILDLHRTGVSPVNPPIDADLFRTAGLFDAPLRDIPGLVQALADKQSA